MLLADFIGLDSCEDIVRVLSTILLPFAPKYYRHIRRRSQGRANTLFDGDDRMFKRVVLRARVYGEYGVGASTDWVYENTNARIVAVDTSIEWARSVLRGKDPLRISIEFADCGPLGDWGRPLTYEFRDKFASYTEKIWTGGSKPDTVLIDGRFRVCCFLTSLLRADPGTKLIFDDYNDRIHYHVVEEVLKPVEKCGRQALFELSADFDRELAETLARDFRMVMD